MKPLIALLLLSSCAAPVPDFVRGDPPVDAPPPEVLETAGSLGIFYWEKPGPQGDLLTGAQFSASFWDVLQEAQPGVGGVEIVSPDAVGDCALTTWTAAEAEVVGGSDAVLQPLLAGSITLSGPSWSVPVLPGVGDGPTPYYFELNPDHVVDFEAGYSVQAAGGGFPAFDVPDAVWIPAQLQLSSPASDEAFVLDGGDFEIAWSGGSEDEVWIELANEDPLAEGNAQITCRALGDGAFTIPAALVAGLPSGVPLRLTVDQPISGSFEVEGLSVGVGSTASAQALGQRL